MNLNYFLCGGAGINIGKAMRKTPTANVSKVNRDAKLIGLDSSGANDAEDLFEVLRMPSVIGSDGLAKGSGKVQSTNYPKAVPFIKEALSKNPPGVFNIVVFGTSGGTGPMLGTLLVRELIQRKLPVIAVVISDHTSLQEKKNCVTTLRNLAAQTNVDQLNAPVGFIELVNAVGTTRGEINTLVVNNLNLLSVFLNEDNEEADFQDIYNLLNYNKVLGVPPALSRIRFFNKEEALAYEGKPPVAYCSLFDHRDNIVPRFVDGGYRVTGVLNELNNGLGMEEIHMLLDHGEALEDLSKAVGELDTKQASKSLTYAPVASFGSGDANGLSFD